MSRAQDQTNPVKSALPLEPAPFRKALSGWYREHARALPWRGVRNPYGTWLSEIMLQQTRVATVTERYVAFLQRFPTLADLAAAPEDDVLALWSGLGYYRRARMLHRGAQFVVRELGGVLPNNAVDLRTLPGVGEYTAAAIASIAFGQSIAVLDGNVERVLLRLLGRTEDKAAAARRILLDTANALVPAAANRRGSKVNPPGDHNQAMMELGATICLPRNPLCLHCPVFAFCHTRGEHPTGSRPALRSRHIAHLLTTRKHGTATEVLLERRPAEASLMPGMLELPPLPLEAAEGREPALRLRHAITNTNYYVEIYTEGAPGLLPDEDVASGNRSNAGLISQLYPRILSPGTEEQSFFPPALLAEIGEAILQQPEPSAAFTARQDAIARRSALLAEAMGSLFRETPGAFGAEKANDAEDGNEAAPSGERGESSGARATLRSEIPAAAEDLLWCPTHRLGDQPLTGLARKTLQRMGLMPMRAVRVKDAGSV